MGPCGPTCVPISTAAATTTPATLRWSSRIGQQHFIALSRNRNPPFGEPSCEPRLELPHAPPIPPRELSDRLVARLLDDGCTLLAYDTEHAVLADGNLTLLILQAPTEW